MKRIRTSVMVAISLAAVCSAQSNAVAGLQVSVDARVAAVEQKVAPTRARVDLLRQTLAPGTVLSAVRAAAIASGHLHAVDAVRPSGSAPLTFNQAVASIRSAMARAGRITRHSPAARLASRFTLQRALDLSFAVMHMQRRPTGIPTPSPAPALRAAAIIATAVDRAMPALQTAARTMQAERGAPTTDAAPPGCDLVDQTPNLCVGGVGDNLYTQDEAVVIDLAGNDQYLTATGAPTAGPSLSLDLAGNDTYAATGTAAAWSQGAGTFGGVGIGVDVTGDDTYRLQSSTGAASGQGVGFFGGAGFLLDGNGSDTYTQDSAARGPANAGAAGQGEGFFGGAAGFVDSGVGNDVYSMHAVQTPKLDSVTDEDGNEIPVTLMGDAAAAGQGVGGFGGAGLFSDSGGTDSFTIDTHITSVPADWPPVTISKDALGAVLQFVQAAGQGDAVLGGAAFALEGPGDTTYTQRAVMEPVPIDQAGIRGNVIGQGYGPTGTLGVLSDAGGNDTYSVTASTASHVAFTAMDGCVCDQAIAAEIGPVTSTVQGYGANGEGFLDDGGGNDAFSVNLSSSVDVSIDDRRTHDAGPLSGSATSAPVTAYGQAIGLGAAGTGTLVDAVGDDTYSLVANTTAHADGSATVAANEPQLVPTPGTVKIDGQGGGSQNGVGSLVDLGGSDTYTARGASTSSIGAHPADSGAVGIHVQGATDLGPSMGLLVDLDGTGTDHFTQVPAQAACQGTRGQSVWQDCGQYGLGVNA